MGQDYPALRVPRAPAVRPLACATMDGLRLRAACGVLGPVGFTAAWAAAGAGQAGYSVAVEHISGLAAPDAVRPHVMTAGFLTLGAATAAFAGALEQALGGRGRAGAVPVLVRAAGLAGLAAGALRRDRMLLDPPDPAPTPSWRNTGHDLASAVAYGAMLAAPVALWWRSRDDARWAPLGRPALAVAASTGALLGVFVTRVAEPWNGVLQRVAVTIPAAAMAVLAVRLLRRPPTPATGPQPRVRRWSRRGRLS